MKEGIALKRLLCFLLLPLLLPMTGVLASAEAFSVSEALTDEQLRTVCSNFGVSVDGGFVQTVSTEEENQCFDGLSAVLPEESERVYCVYARALSRGDGLEVRTSNIRAVSDILLSSVLLTAGVTDAQIYVGAPYSVSGIAVPAEIFNACAAIGQTVSETEKKAAVTELTLARSLMTDSGTYDVLLLLNDRKQTAGKTASLSDAELLDSITQAAEKRKVSLTESQRDELLALCRLYESLDTSALKRSAGAFEKTLNTLNTQENGGALTRWVGRMAASLAEKCESLLDDLINKVL